MRTKPATFGPRYPRELATIRRAMGLTQRQAAARVGLSRETISRIERGGAFSELVEYLIVSRLGLTPEQHRRAFGFPGPRTTSNGSDGARHPHLVVLGGEREAGR